MKSGFPLSEYVNPLAVIPRPNRLIKQKMVRKLENTSEYRWIGPSENALYADAYRGPRIVDGYRGSRSRGTTVKGTVRFRPLMEHLRGGLPKDRAASGREWPNVSRPSAAHCTLHQNRTQANSDVDLSMPGRATGKEAKLSQITKRILIRGCQVMVVDCRATGRINLRLRRRARDASSREVDARKT